MRRAKILFFGLKYLSHLRIRLDRAGFKLQSQCEKALVAASLRLNRSVIKPYSQHL